MVYFNVIIFYCWRWNTLYVWPSIWIFFFSFFRHLIVLLLPDIPHSVSHSRSDREQEKHGQIWCKQILNTKDQINTLKKRKSRATTIHFRNTKYEFIVFIICIIGLWHVLYFIESIVHSHSGLFFSLYV